VAPDLRGHGDSTKPSSGYQSQDFITDLRALMGHLHWERAHILGHSWMGKVACIWATHHPQDFQSLTLVDPFFINKIPRWSKFTFDLFYKILPFLQTMGPFDDYATAERIAQGLKQYQGWSELQQSVFQFSMETKPDGRWGSKFTIAARNEIFEDVMVNAGLTQTIDVPTLFIQPDQGLNRSPWQLKPYRQYLPNLQIKQVPGNHWAFLVQPQTFNAAIKKFLTQQTPTQ
jgi:pimeloyl-ACP methyl ester carboxylesterase